MAFIPDDIEPRSIFAQLILEGYIPFYLIISGLVLGFIAGIISLFEKKILAGISIIIITSCLLLIMSMFAVFSIRDLGVFKQDKIIYRSGSISSQKIVFQYYETGVTGNPNWRSIIVQDIDASFRKIEDAKIDLNSQSGDYQSILSDHNINQELLPSLITVEGNSYILETVNAF